MKKIKTFSLAITMSIFYGANAQESLEFEAKKQSINEKPRIIFKPFTSVKPALIVIDDIIISDSIFKTIDPKIIEHIEVLKGEKALTEYGKNGQNGVIVIKTKKKSDEDKQNAKQ